MFQSLEVSPSHSVALAPLGLSLPLAQPLPLPLEGTLDVPVQIPLAVERFQEVKLELTLSP